MTVHLSLDERAQEQAALFALGALEEGEALEYRNHIQGCANCRAYVDSLHASLKKMALLAPSSPPPESLRDRVLQRIRPDHGPGAATTQAWKAWGASESGSLRVLRAGDGDWEQTAAPGVRVRRLHSDPANDRVTMLVLMEPGSSYPRHRHGGHEECYVLSGDLHVGPSIVMRAGDFQRVEPDSVHEIQSTETGCLLHISSSLSDELLEHSDVR